VLNGPGISLCLPPGVKHPVLLYSGERSVCVRGNAAQTVYLPHEETGAVQLVAAALSLLCGQLELGPDGWLGYPVIR